MVITTLHMVMLRTATFTDGIGARGRELFKLQKFCT
jgi:hypothetical protein